MEINEIFNHIYYLLIVLISNLIIPNYNLLIKMISVDGLISSLHFLKIFFDTNLTESQIVNESYSLYQGSVLDRYIFYLLQYLVYKLVCETFWLPDFNSTHLFLLIPIIPPFINRIMKTRIFSKIIYIKESIIKLIISKLSANGVNNIAKLYLNRDVKVKHREILPLLDNYRDSLNYFTEALKNGLIIFLLTYIRGYSPRFYYRMSKYIYNYKTGDMLISMNSQSAKDLLNKIIDNRDWGELIKPNGFRAILQLYQENNDDNNYFKLLMVNINYKIIKMFAIWSLTSFLNSLVLGPFISLFFMLYRDKYDFFKNVNNYYKSGVLIVCGILGDLSGSFMIMSFLCEFAPSIAINPISFSLLRKLGKKTNKLIKYILRTNENLNRPFMIFMIYLIAFRLLLDDYKFYFSIPLHLLVLLINKYNEDRRFEIMVLLILSTCVSSNYNLWHLIFNGSSFYLASAFLEDLTLVEIAKLLMHVRDNLINISIDIKRNFTYFRVNITKSKNSREYKLNNQPIVRKLEWDDIRSMDMNGSIIEFRHRIKSDMNNSSSDIHIDNPEVIVRKTIGDTSSKRKAFDLIYDFLD